MFELLVCIAAIGAVVRVAVADNQSGLLWGLITFGLCAACVVMIPLAFIRVGIAFALALLAMFIYKVAANR